ncbi:hypothetical protein [Kitasatospora sp. NPDC093806]|uniref:hypothetical protein n=1 Tax=Kitasatospora sp. NPDC093806 TaxID=3155075 RepID=UPI00342DBF93
MGSSFYVSAAGAPWAFSREQLADALARHWPGATVSDVFERFVEIHAEVAPGQVAELSFHKEHKVFSFADREPWSAALTVLHTVLGELAPGVPAVWWIDFDGTLEPLELSLPLEQFIDDFGA